MTTDLTDFPDTMEFLGLVSKKSGIKKILIDIKYFG